MSNSILSNPKTTIVGGGGVRPQPHNQSLYQYLDGYGSSDNDDEKPVMVLPPIITAAELQVKIDNENKINKFNKECDAKCALKKRELAKQCVLKQRELEKQCALEKQRELEKQNMMDLKAASLIKTVIILHEDKCIQCCFDDDVEVLPLTEEEKKALRVQSQQPSIVSANNEIKTLNALITVQGKTPELKRLMKNARQRLRTSTKIINDETYKIRKSENAKIKRQILRDTAVVPVCGVVADEVVDEVVVADEVVDEVVVVDEVAYVVAEPVDLRIPLTQEEQTKCRNELTKLNARLLNLNNSSYDRHLIKEAIKRNKARLYFHDTVDVFQIETRAEQAHFEQQVYNSKQIIAHETINQQKFSNRSSKEYVKCYNIIYKETKLIERGHLIKIVQDRWKKINRQN